MPHIKVLPVDLRNKIAAGEVIERPASVVKELVENAIDAGSSEIRIEVLYGGKRMIKVSDNGSGMGREDALLCLEPHATSKLSKEDDLFDIRTLGFRGEALPSIASVSKMKIVTGEREVVGVSIEISGGEIKEIKDAPFTGTSVEVRDLFFNMPARKKFLKTDNTELYHIIDNVTKEAISHYRTGFTLLTDSNETMLLPDASGYRERIMQIYGEEFLKGLMEVDATGAGITMKALVSVNGNFRNSKAHQFVFINSRPVKDQAISHAVYKAYEGILPQDKHPVFFLFLDIDPKKIDVNVHPTKREVRFADKEAIYKFLHGSIRDEVKKYRVSYAAEFGEAPEQQISSPAPAAYAASPYTDINVSVSDNIGLTYRPSLPFIYLGDTFIAVSGKGGLTLIDHHAAHERILYEKFLRRIELKSHHLLFPEQLKLSYKEYRVMLENKDLLNEFGIEIDDFGHDTLIIRALPDVMAHTDLRGLFSDIASALLEGVRPDIGLKNSIAARIACHASVRGKEILNQEELSALLSDLETTEHPDQCPHGRPTRIFYSIEDLKKMFKKKMNTVLILLGPTGVGKTGASLLLAKELGTEIISADSMQIYKGMDIGTAKATSEERATINHHMVDIVSPMESYSAGRYVEAIVPVIEGLHNHGRIPVITGGTGLYIKAITRGLFSGPSADWTLREELLSMEKAESGSLYAYLEKLDPATARTIDKNDLRRLVRATEVCLKSSEKMSLMKETLTKPLPYNFIKIGLTRAREELYRIIDRRVDAMILAGLAEETERLLQMGPDRTPLQAIGYREFALHIKGEISLDEAIRLIKRNTRRYAKRQFTWFKKEEDIIWTDVTGIGDSYGIYWKLRAVLEKSYPDIFH